MNRQSASGRSTLAEKSFGINKTIGDLAGPMAFAILMGSSRAFYGKFGDKINLERFMQYSAILCMISYLMIAFIPVPALGSWAVQSAVYPSASCGREHLVWQQRL